MNKKIKQLVEAAEYAVHELTAMRGTDFPEGNFDCLVCNVINSDKHIEGCPVGRLEEALKKYNN